MKKAIPPAWCNQRDELNHRYACCHCNRVGVYYQEGDGKRVHSLCLKCYKKLYGKKGGD